MIRITDDHAPRLLRMSPASILPALSRELEDSAEIIATDAKVSVLDGGISGSGHIASEPGQPPNADTHDLDKSIHQTEAVEVDGYIRTSVVVDSDHAFYLERGTSKMIERPFLGPAVERHRRPTVGSLALVFNKTVR